MGIAACSESATPLLDAPHSDALQPLASTSLCADSYLLAIAPDRVSALSWQAGSDLSTASGPALETPRLQDSREALFGVDYAVISGPGSANPGALDLMWGEDFDTVEQNLEALQTLTQADITALESALKATENLPPPPVKPRILYLTRSGGSAGAGTFVDAVIQRAGGVNAARAPGWHTPSVEAIITTQADIVLTSFFGTDYHGVTDRAIRHSALRDYIAQHPRIDIPGRLWPCAGPGLIEATQQVHAGVLDWSAKR